MEQERDNPAQGGDAERDRRGTEAPAGAGGDAEEQESGPFGNPAEDEEALANRQQERDSD